MRIPVIAGNWKLFKTSSEAVSLVQDLKPLIGAVSHVEVVIAPVFTVLTTVAGVLAGSGLKLSAQDCFWEDEGAYTGEVGPRFLVDAGCSHVIIGHSERRQYFGETDETVNRKARSAIASGLTAIICVGETLADRDNGLTFKVIEKQLINGLADLGGGELGRVIVAYEPVWAIGTGKTATDEQAQEVHLFIRTLIGKLFGDKVAEEMRILYGGSVKPENIASLMAKPDIDGALVGGASLKADSFAAIVRNGCPSA